MDIKSSLVGFYRAMTLSADDRLLIEEGIEDPSGHPTDEGKRLSKAISYAANRAEVIRVVKQRKAERDAESA